MPISIYQQQLGADFSRLHPQLQERLTLHSSVARAFVGEGTMERVWHGPFYTLPFLWIGLRRRIMFPETGTNIPFRIENYAYRDALGRETVTWIRRFAFPGGPTRCFDATMIFSPARGQIVDYLGTHQHLAVDIELGVSARGGLLLRSSGQRFHEGPLAFRFPGFLAGLASVEEWFDDATDQFRIQVEVTNPRFGRLFGYNGTFRGRWVEVVDGQIPAYALPRRTEARE